MSMVMMHVVTVTSAMASSVTAFFFPVGVGEENEEANDGDDEKNSDKSLGSVARFLRLIRELILRIG